MRPFIFFTVSLCALLAACPPPQPLDPNVEPPDTVDGSAPSSCLTACDNLRAHHCTLGDKTRGGASCEDVCVNARANGVVWPLSCLTRDTTCHACNQ